MSEEKGLFEKLYENAKEALKTIQKPQIRRSMKRSIESAYDDADAQIDRLSVEIQDEMAKLKDFNLSNIIDKRRKVKALTESKEELKAVHKELFGKDLEVRG